VLKKNELEKFFNTGRKSNDKQALESRVKALTKEDFGNYKFKNYRFHDGFGDRKNEFWITLVLDVEGTGYYED